MMINIAFKCLTIVVGREFHKWEVLGKKLEYNLCLYLAISAIKWWDLTTNLVLHLNSLSISIKDISLWVLSVFFIVKSNYLWHDKIREDVDVSICSHLYTVCANQNFWNYKIILNFENNFLCLNKSYKNIFFILLYILILYLFFPSCFSSF